MTNQTIEASEFYVAGGTMRPGSPSYVKRPADEELFEQALAGEFCYVLTARQMGKSSLMIRTARRLEAQGVHSAIIDLNRIGGSADISTEHWYLGFLNQLKRKLKLSVDLEDWWPRQTVGYVQRFTDFLHDVVLQEKEGQIVIFIDEIDSTFNLPFSDDFFAAIRGTYNDRATDAIYERLTFILLGVATPSELIKDPRRTPFNIGQEIDLTDFSREDAQLLQEGLIIDYPEAGETIFDRIYYWTNGHPYLTQKLCLEAIETKNEVWTDKQVDKLVEKLFLTKEARKETNLKFIQDSIANSPRRKNLLTLYRQVYTGKQIPEDERSLDQNRLRLFGLVRVEGGILQTRNEIYCQVFDLAWIKQNTPVDWSRRLVILLTFIIILLIGGLVGLNYWQNQTDRQRHIDQFRATTDPDIRITSLAGLFDLGDQEQARQLFDEGLKPDERPVLFKWANPQNVGPELITVVKGLYTRLENNEVDNNLLRAMAEPLENIENDARVEALSQEISQWLKGREFYNQGEYRQAVEAYNEAINFNDRNPGVYFDRAMAYMALNQAKQALADFEKALQLDESRKTQIGQIISSDPLLYQTVITSEGKSYPAVIAAVPTPTPIPTPTFTPTFTPIPTFTATPSSTPSPTPTFTPTETPTEAAAILPPTDTPTPIPTSTFTPTPTPTPRPATIVYVQSRDTNHDLGLVSSTGELLDAGLHPLAAAPAWSPNGAEVAFYGEQGISELGGIYAQGNGIWIIDIQTRTPRLLFQVDHVRNMNWSADGSKLALEFGPQYDPTHAVVIVDAQGGRELNSFPGEQPTWLPNSTELVIKSCQPECGLWQVGGAIDKLLTRDPTDSYPDVSSDGKYLVFSSRSRHTDWEIYRLDLESPDVEPLRLTNRPGTDTTPVFSPDGLEIYWRTDAFGDWQIMAMAVDGSNERVIRAGIGASDDWGLARTAVH